MNYLLSLIIILLLSSVCYLNYDLKVVNPLITAFTSLVMVIVGLFSKHFYDIWKINYDTKKKRRNIANLLIQELDLCKNEWNKYSFNEPKTIYDNLINGQYDNIYNYLSKSNYIYYVKLAILETYLKDIYIFDNNLILNLTKFYNQYNSYIDMRKKYIFFLEQYVSNLSSDHSYGPNIDKSNILSTKLQILNEDITITIKELELLFPLIIKDLKIYTEQSSYQRLKKIFIKIYKIYIFVI